MDKHTIWNENEFIEIDDIRDDYPECTDQELERIANELHYSYLDDERVNLNIEVEGTIVCFADIGRWNGRFSGYKALGSNIADILHPMVNSQSYCHWFINEDMSNVCCDEAHHDATNHYVYRLVSDADLEEAEEHDNCVDWLLARSQPIVEPVRKVYGW